jgi:hypothetical protein
VGGRVGSRADSAGPAPARALPAKPGPSSRRVAAAGDPAGDPAGDRGRRLARLMCRVTLARDATRGASPHRRN